MGSEILILRLKEESKERQLMGKILSQIYKENKFYFIAIFALTFVLFSLLYSTYELESWWLYSFLTACATLLTILIGGIYGKKMLSKNK
jgi:hypothetical protein